MSSPTLKLVIIGAGGLVGSRLAERIVQQQTVHTTDGPAELCRVVLFDARNPRGLAPAVLRDPRTSVVIGDLCDKVNVWQHCVLQYSLFMISVFSHLFVIYLAHIGKTGYDDTFNPTGRLFACLHYSSGCSTQWLRRREF